MAPEICLADSSTRLFELRGTPVVIVFSVAEWDPARDELAARYSEWCGRSGDIRVLTESRPEIAAAFGVTGDASFVVDGEGVIRWRYVPGIDAVPVSSDEARLTSTEHSSTVPGDLAEWTRREFVQAAVAAATLLALTALASKPVAAVLAAEPPPPAISGTGPVTLTVNGRDLALELEPRVTLLDALRNYAGLTGTKKGCDHGQCGACTVHVDGRRVLSCLTFAVMQQGKKITTIEGLATGDTLHPMQQAFITHDGFQCGYCTSGQIMSATAVVQEPWGPADDDVREAMSGNICRCGAYPGIVAAVQTVRGHSRGAPR
jgi:xanthine dehydrogenase YagT iron-sulfur-binding subunit